MRDNFITLQYVVVEDAVMFIENSVHPGATKLVNTFQYCPILTLKQTTVEHIYQENILIYEFQRNILIIAAAIVSKNRPQA